MEFQCLESQVIWICFLLQVSQLMLQHHSNLQLQLLFTSTTRLTARIPQAVHSPVHRRICSVCSAPSLSMSTLQVRPATPL